MNTISREELQRRLGRKELTLVMPLPRFAYARKHIPGTLHFETVEDALAVLDPAEEIVVYCADLYCAASVYAYHLLERAGYQRVRRYAGGIADWEAAGYPLEGATAGATAERAETRRPRLRAPASRPRLNRPWPVGA